MTTDTRTPEPYAATDAPQPEVEFSFEDYWGVQETFFFKLPDGKQYFEIKPMDEGGKTRFQKKTNKGIRVNQKSQDAHLDVDPADERHQLIIESVVSWSLFQKDPKDPRGFSELPCPTDDSRRKSVIRDLILEKFNPKVIQDLEFFVRTSNPWMQADMDLEAIDEELDRLHVLRKQKLEHDAGEDASATS